MNTNYIFFIELTKEDSLFKDTKFQESALCQLDLVVPLGNKLVLFNYQSHLQTLVPLEICQSFRVQLSRQKHRKRIQTICN